MVPILPTSCTCPELDLPPSSVHFLKIKGANSKQGGAGLAPLPSTKTPRKALFWGARAAESERRAAGLTQVEQAGRMAFVLQVQPGPQVLPEVPRRPPEPLQVPGPGGDL